MNIAQLINYYPKYEYLDNIVASSSAKKINIFVDLKGCIQSLYQEWAIRYLIDQSNKKSDGARYIDDSLFASVLEFINFHKIYARKRSIELNLYIFSERGESTYHINIYKDYKKNRGNTLSFLTTEQRDIFRLVLNRNFDLIENIGNRIPNIYVIKLDHLEADFIPYHIRKCLLGSFKEHETDIIYSVDKDMLQCLDNPNTYIFYKHYMSHKILDHKTAYTHYLKKDWNYPEIGLEWFPLLLSINGDSSDGFDGVKGLGPSFLTKNIKEVIKLVGGSVDEMYRRIQNKSNIFDPQNRTNNKNIDKLICDQDKIIRNLKLSSYKLINDYLIGGYPLDTIQKNRYITETINNKEKIENGAVVLSAFKRAGLTTNLLEQTIYNIFR